MKKPDLSLKSIFNRHHFDRIFVRQIDDFSCAAASAATISNLYGIDLDTHFFRNAMKMKLSGADSDKIEKACLDHLPVESHGWNTYHNGIALGFIRHKPDGDDHAVVFLARENDTLVYYDPYDHRIFHDDVKNMRRAEHNDDPYRLWTANFPEIKGKDFNFWMKCAEQNPYKLQDQAFWIRERNKKSSQKPDA